MSDAESFDGFRESQFELFAIEEFDGRMTRLRDEITPTLRALGDLLAPELEAETGLDFYPHVATHARRTKNPADDTWVAFGRNSRGYKKYAHLSVGVQYEGLYVDFTIKGEAREDKHGFARQLGERRLEALRGVGRRGQFDWYRVPKKEGRGYLDRVAFTDITGERLNDIAERLTDVKSYGVTIGTEIPRTDERVYDADTAADVVEQCLFDVMPLYMLTLDGVAARA